MILPPKVIHTKYQKTDNLAEIAADCAKALHLSKGEADLLRYYSTTSSGFRPALKTVANAIGKTTVQVWRCRDKLADIGIVTKDGDIVIDWQKAKTFASLDPKLTKKNCVRAKRSAVPLNKDLIAALPESMAVQILSEMTESEFQKFMRKNKR